MRILALSDLHDDISRLRILREQEENNFEALVVAGDVGDKYRNEKFEILDSFECPVLIVYGNWDNKATYDGKVSKNSVLLHHKTIQVNEYFFTGFSGSPTSWGLNPIYLEEKKMVEQKHADILEKYKQAKAHGENQKQEIESKYIILLESMASRVKDRRKKAFKKRVALIEKKKEEELENISERWRRVIHSRKYKLYKNDCGVAVENATKRNIKRMFEVIGNEQIPAKKSIVVSHERIYHFAEQGFCPLMHIYGHRHKYQFNKFKGTYYLNASPMDYGCSGFFGGTNLNSAGYCRLKFDPANNKVDVERITFKGQEKPTQSFSGVFGN